MQVPARHFVVSHTTQGKMCRNMWEQTGSRCLKCNCDDVTLTVCVCVLSHTTEGRECMNSRSRKVLGAMSKPCVCVCMLYTEAGR